MVKPLLLVALVAKTFLLVSSTGTAQYSSSSAAASSSAASSSSSSSSSSHTVQRSSSSASAAQFAHQHQSSSSSAAASASAASSASGSSSCTGPAPPSSCGPPQAYCSVNEVWSNCPIAVCVPKTCDQVGFPVACPDLRPDGQCPDKPGCICKENYVRNHDGVCIPIDRCPSCGGDPNAVICRYGNYNRLCSNYKNKPGCTAGCGYNTCECRLGFVYDEIKRKCVYASECSRMICQKNEVYDACPAPCPFRTCGINDALVRCQQPLCPGDPNCPPPKCRCQDGYYRNDVGVCVLWEQCPVCRGINEQYDPCPATCPPQRCDVDIALILCMEAPKLGDPECKPGCRCFNDYVRNHTGVCIPRDQCPTCPNKNEVYDPCIAPCPPRRCDVDERVIRCAAPPKLGDKDCVAGCRCADGYYKNSYGICVTRAECPNCFGPNEVYACGGACDNVCATLHEQNQTNCPIHNIRCNDMCYCKEGYARDENNVCIPIKDCKVPKCKGKHEVFNECIQGDCNPKTCSELGFSIPCPRIDPKYCKKGCLCKPDYVRDKNGVCIHKKHCPSCGGDPHAESGCGNNCGNLCSNYFKDNVACTLECNINGCDCRKGYVYDSNTKRCVLPKDCTPVCKKDEVYSDCVNKPCPVRNCSYVNITVLCEEIDPKDCIKGCVCEEPYMREDDGSCVLIFDCKPPVCKKNEVFSDCINGGCTAKNCSQIGHPIPCVKLDYRSCIKGCLCIEGYLRDDNGVCIPEKDCKPRCNKPNEYYEPCDYNCPPNTCESLDRAYACPIREGDTCKGRCKCKKGYFRNKIGECITEEKCRRCMGPHEYHSCGGACDNVCATLHERNQTICPIINIKCNEKCYCEKNYARAKNGTCIPIKDCKKPQCGKHERYEKCPAWLCKPQKCSELGYPIPCPDDSDDSDDSDEDECPDKPACVCVDGYVRNHKGKCIPKKDCPSCGGDPNAESGCGTNCNKKCEDLGNDSSECEEKCCENGCDCKDGYYYDKNKKKCVLPSQCTDICSGRHEVFENCTNPVCRPKKCSEVGFPLNCTNPPECKKGCYCKENYVRNAKGICIPIKHCPSCGGDKNAESGCGVNCLKKCYDLQHPKHPKPCEKICKINSCDCKKGYYYDANTKKCVPASKCTPNCNLDEIPDDCINGGCNVKNCSQIGDPPCDIDSDDCITGCSCKDGYLRSDEGLCIPVEKCPDAKCGKNEKFVTCPDAFCGPRRCDQLGYPIKCPIIGDDYCCPGPPGCICIDGYVRNNKGKCIHKRDCPSCGGDPNAWSGCGTYCNKTCEHLEGKTKKCPKICIQNSCDCRDGFYYDKNVCKCVTADCCTPSCCKNEVYDKCANGGCGPRNCSEIDGPIICIDPKDCEGGCVCKEGYLRLDDTGVCVPKEKCPKICNKPNEEYVECPQTCPPQTCESINKTYHCPKVKTNEEDCVGECRCIEDYYRNLIGECIHKKDCMKCTGDHEYFSCGPACDNVCADLDTQSKENCPIKNKKCVPRCYCEDGYARDDDGVCVCIEDCPGKCKETKNKKCVPKCICKDSDDSDDDGVCVCKEDCPEKCKNIKNKKCSPKCNCKDGDASDDDGICECKEDCPAKCKEIKDKKCVSNCKDGDAKDDDDVSVCKEDNPDDPAVNTTVALANLELGNTKLSIDFIKELIESNPGENFMVSAFSVMIAMAQITMGAKGESREQLLQFLNLENNEEISTAFSTKIEGLKSLQGVILEVANKYYANEKECPVTQKFKDIAEIFSSEAEDINFSDSEKAAYKINAWVANHTRGLIDDIAKPDMFSSLTRLAIFNVIYFLGNWKKQFDPKNTKLDDFYLNDKDTVELQMMTQRNTFEYGESDELDAKMIVMPYVKDECELVICLPNEKDGLQDLLEKLNPDRLDKFRASLTYEKCDMSMPRMDIVFDFSDLKSTLIKLNVTAPFEPNSNDFVGILQNNEPVTITDAVQKAVFKVNELGTEAAVVTGVTVGVTSVQLPTEIKRFEWNRPGVFFLRCGKTLLFSGAFVGAK